MLTSGLMVFSMYKVVKNSYIMATQAGTVMAYAPFTFLWLGASFVQYYFLSVAYLQQVYLVDEIELLENMKQIRIRTVFFNMKSNLFAQARLAFADKESVRKEYTVDIKDCKFSEKDKPEEQILRM